MAEWRVIGGFSRYEVSDDGRVRRAVGNYRGPAGSELSIHIRNVSQESYRRRRAVTLYDDSGRRHVRNINRLVAEAFIPNPEGKPFVCHWDGDLKNDTAANLYRGTAKDNYADQRRHGNVQEGPRGPRILTVDQILRARILNTPAKALADEFGCSKGLIYHIRQGRRHAGVMAS